MGAPAALAAWRQLGGVAVGPPVFDALLAATMAGAAVFVAASFQRLGE